MILDCLARVIRTRGIKTAPAAEQRAHGNLVETQQSEKYRSHDRAAICRRAISNSEPKAGVMVPRAVGSRLKPRDGRSRALPCRAKPLFHHDTAPSAVATRHWARPFCRTAYAAAAAHPNHPTPHDAAGKTHGRYAAPNSASPRAARTSCQSRARAVLRFRSAAHTARNARCVARGANEKRMKIHPFSVASRLWGRQLALATEPSPVAALEPFPRDRRDSARRAIRSPALDGQTLAALRAACVDDLAATRGLHANAEAMGALAARHGRLESTFHVALT
jgi:hypothetical protein